MFLVNSLIAKCSQLDAGPKCDLFTADVNN